VHEKTRYGGQLENLESMEIGWQAGVAALEDQEGRLNAAVVIAGERQERPDLERFRGTVTAVDAAAGKFRLETPDGEELTFFVSERTRYRGQVEGLDDLQVGWKAVVGAAEDEDGVLQAVLVAAGDPEDLPDMIRFRGTVTAVDAAAGKFRLETPDGEELTFFVRERTRYRGQVEGLDDLQVGWKAVVGAAEDEDGALQAVLVAAGDPEDLPDMIRFRGTVTAVDAAAGKFRLETPDGEELTFFVRERTRYKGELNSLAELQIGWQAGVGGFEGEEGQLQALVVIAGEGRPGGRFGDPGEEFAPGSPPFGPEADF
jgi:ribosomal protein S8E